MRDERLERWLDALLAAPGLTAITDRAEARAMLLEDSLRGADIVRALPGPIVDVGSGGGVPGIPLAAALPERQVVLLEATRRKAEFLERWAREFANVTVRWGRAEEVEVDTYGTAVAKALAHPPTALEWCLPLVAEGGAAVLWVGRDVDPRSLAGVAEQLGGGMPELRNGLLVVPKAAPTPAGFPRRPGVAKKRPLT